MTLAALFFSVGVPLITLISMVSSYRDRLEQNTEKIAELSKEIAVLENNSNTNNSSIDVFRQGIQNNSNSVLEIKQLLNNYDEKILEIWKETSANNAKIEALKTEVIWLKSNYDSKNH